MKQKTTQNRKPYTPPTIRPLIALPPMQHITVWEFRGALAEWYLPDLVSLHELLCMAERVPLPLPILINAVENAINNLIPKASVPA